MHLPEIRAEGDKGVESPRPARQNQKTYAKEDSGTGDRRAREPIS